LLYKIVVCGRKRTAKGADMKVCITNRSTKSLVALASAYLIVLILIVVPFAAAQTATFKGEITDEHLNCIQTPVKAVEGVTKKEGCVLYWAHFAKPPSKFVLYDAATKTTYQLDDQNWVEPYVGETVQITGTLNAATKTIHITGVKKS
jgi:hypothetical protein